MGITGRQVLKLHEHMGKTEEKATAWEKHWPNEQWVKRPTRYILGLADWLTEEQMDLLPPPEIVANAALCAAEDLICRYQGTGCGFGTSDWCHEMAGFVRNWFDVGVDLEAGCFVVKGLKKPGVPILPR